MNQGTEKEKKEKIEKEKHKQEKYRSTGPLRRSDRLKSTAIPTMTEVGDDMDASLGGDDFLGDSNGDAEYDPYLDASEDEDKFVEEPVMEQNVQKASI